MFVGEIEGAVIGGGGMSLWGYYDKHPEEFWKDFGGVRRKKGKRKKEVCPFKLPREFEGKPV